MTLFKLALRFLKKDWRHMVFVAAPLFPALLILCTAWVQYISYDENIYLSAYSPWDYILFDGSAQISVQRYNEKNQNLTERTVEKIKEQAEVTDISVMKTHETELTASPELREYLVEFYNKKTEEGISRKEMMANQKGWINGLERLEKTGKYTAIIVGTEGAFLDYILHDQPIVQGEFDQEKFLSGDYALTAGAVDTELASLPAGAQVEIAGKNLEIMTVAQVASNFFCGANSPDAEFNLIYCVPLETFDQMFPGQAYRQAAVNIKEGKEKSFEAFLSQYQESVNTGIGFRSKGEYRENFYTARLNEVLAFFIIGTVILAAGLINYGNILLTKIIIEKREFAVYESLGMTVGQLKKLLITEGLLQGGVLLLILIPSVFLITWPGLPVWFSQMGSWCMVYRYSLLPLWIAAMILVLMSVLIPLLGLAAVRKGTIHDRMGIRE